MRVRSDRLRERVRALAMEDPCPEVFIARTGRLLRDELVDSDFNKFNLQASSSPAAVAILGPDGRIASITEGARLWVEELVTEGSRDREHHAAVGPGRLRLTGQRRRDRSCHAPTCASSTAAGCWSCGTATSRWPSRS